MGQKFVQAAAYVVGVIGGMAAAVSSAWGGPLRPEWVAPDATWVVHVDAETLATSQLGRAALAHSSLLIQDELTVLHDDLGIDITKDIFSVTAFGVDETEHTFTVVLEATSVIDQLLAGAPQQFGAAYKNITEGDKTIHAWSNDGDEFFAYVKNSDVPDRRLVLVSMELLRLRDGMLRLEARAPGANIAQPLAASRPSAGSILFLSAQRLPGMNGHGGPAAAVLQNAKGLVLDIGEVAGRLAVTAEVDTGNAETAMNLQAMAQGFVAMGRMAGAQEPDVQQFLPLLNGLSLTSEGSTFRIRFEHESAGLVRLLDAIEQHENGNDNADDKDVEVEVKVQTSTKVR